MDRFYIFEKDMKKQGCNSLICDILFGDFPRKDRADPSPPLRLQQVLVLPRRTEAVNWRQRGGGLLSLVNTCGEIGLCTPCTEATPSAEGVASVSGGWRRRGW